MSSPKKILDILLNALYGCVIGVANIIPGVSGGTMAVMLNIYDKLIDAFTGLRKRFGKSMKFLLPIVIGAALGIVIFSKLIKFLIAYCPLPTCFFFIGLIVGSLPLVFRRAVEKPFRPISLQNTASTAAFQLDFGSWMLLFGGSAVAAMCMIIPGVSGSMILMIFGIYSAIINAISDLTKSFMNSCMILLPAGLGILFGLIFGAKVIDLCIKRFPQMTYFAIIGLMLGSPLVIFMKFQSQSAAAEVNCFVFTPVNIIVSALVCLAGFGIAIIFGSEKIKARFSKRNASKKNTENN